MKINALNSQPFKGVYVLQVKKSAFKEPNSTVSCSDAFRENMNEIARKSPNPRKTFVTLESPGYEEVAAKLEYTGYKNRSVAWALQNYGDCKMSLEKSKDYHTFYVLTGDEFKQANKKDTKIDFNFVEYLAEMYKANKKVKARKPRALMELKPLYTVIEYAIMANKHFEKILDGKKIVFCKADTMKEIDNFAKNAIYNEGNNN